ncbi:hypothetical protein Aph02nite_66040 [Actinoplanes philippinensis]|nr:hypothetical protein Aph02nite_66040 [Actinoplanes philippinensis]
MCRMAARSRGLRSHTDGHRSASHQGDTTTHSHDRHRDAGHAGNTTASHMRTHDTVTRATAEAESGAEPERANRTSDTAARATQHPAPHVTQVTRQRRSCGMTRRRGPRRLDRAGHAG